MKKILLLTAFLSLTLLVAGGFLSRVEAEGPKPRPQERREITTQTLPTIPQSVGTQPAQSKVKVAENTAQPEPAPAAAQPKKYQPPLEAAISKTTEKGRDVFEVTFSYKMVKDKEIIFKKLNNDDRPFRLSADVPLNAYWKTENVLRIEPQLSQLDLEDELNKNPIIIYWKKDVKSSDEGLPLNFISGFDWKTDPLMFVTQCQRNDGGELFNQIELPAYKVQVINKTTGESAGLLFTFTRSMVGDDQLGQPLKLADAPFILGPELENMTGHWQDRRSLLFKGSLTRTDFWDKIVDRTFSLTWKPGFQNFFGDPAPDLKAAEFNDFPEDGSASAFSFSKFAVVGLNQASMDINGRADFDLGFNKPVKLDEIKKHLRVKKYIYKDKNGQKEIAGYQDVPAEVLSVGGPGDEAGTTVCFRLKGLMGERITVSVKGLKSADGRGTITSNPNRDSWVDHFFTIQDTSLEIEENYPWKPYFTINVRETVKFDDIEKFIKLDPPLEFTVSPYGRDGNSIQIFADFTTSVTKVTLLKGLPSQQGVLTEDTSYEVQLPSNLSRKLMFTGRGRYLSQEKPLLVKLAGRNVDKVRLQGWRIYENNLPAIINIQDYDTHTRTKLALQFSKNLLDRTTDVKAGPGEVFERLLDLRQVLDEAPHGAYLLRITPVKKPRGQEEMSEDESYDDEDYEEDDGYYSYYDYYHHTERYLPVMISDLGLSAHVLPGKVSVWANSLSQARPVDGGTVKFYDSANQVLAEGPTDAGGLFTAEVEAANAVFVTVEKDGDLNYLLLGSRRSSYGGEDYDSYDDNYYYEDSREDGNAKWYGGNAGYIGVAAPESVGPMRSYLSRGYEAFLFMPRDMFKPGETVRVKAMIRDKNILPPSEKFPVLWRVNDPDGRTISQGRTQLNQFGGVDFAAEIPFSARTGSWSAALYLPESTAELGQVSFTVEDFVPPRLALELEADQKIYKGQNPEMTVKTDVRYLFGAPGAELNWEMDAVITPASFRPKGWEGFDFTGPPSDFNTTRQRRAARGQLDENGHVDIQYQPNLETDRLPTKMAVEFVVSAQEDGGRWNAKRLGVDYFPRELILGYKAPDSTAVKQPFSFEVAAVNPEGQPAEVNHLDVRVSLVQNQYYNSYRYGRVYRETVEELKLKTETQVGLAHGRASMNFTPETAGQYQIEITDPESGLAIQRRVYVYGLETAEASLPKGIVEMSFDRESYKPGDTAVVKVRSPFPGRLWLTVETTSILHSTTLDMKTTETEVRIPVDESIKTNAVVTATVVRPLAEGQTGYRALGVKSLEIDREIYRLKVAVDMPDRIKPSAKSTLKIKMTDAEGHPAAGEATVSLVDEGVLSLSGFKTPNPWGMFTVGRRMLTIFYDLYEQLLPVEKAAVPFLTPGGGDGLGRSGLFSPFKRKQEILSIFLASVEVDENGEAVVELDVPEYSGQGRLMVVAGSRDRFGSASRNITISRDLTSEATLPLALAPGDTFEIPIRVFAAAEAPEKAGLGAAISLKTEGPIRLEESGAEFNLKSGSGETKVFKAVAEPSETGGDQAGVGRLLIDSRDGLGEEFTQSIEVVVRPPYPRVVTSSSVQTKAAETSITIPSEGYLKGTVEAVLTLAKSPAIEASRAVRYLSEYPYGCLEQTTSKAWMFVAADDLLAGLSPEEAQSEHITHGLNAAVKRLVTMQTNSGGYAYWPGGNEVYEWGSVYAIHFLTEAAKKTELPNGLLERSIKWLQAYLGSNYSNAYDDPSYILSTRAYAVYVLALNGEYRQAWINYLQDRYDGLDPSARVFLAGAEAIHAGNSKPLAILDQKPLDLSVNNLGQRVSSLESAPRNQALKLMVWVEVDPLSETTNKLAWQVSESGRTGLWSNTQENGLAVFALGSYLSKSAAGKPYQATLTGADGQVLFQANPNQVAVAGPKKLAPVQDKPLKLSLTGEGRPYYTLTVGGVPLTAPAPKADDLELIRTWIMEDGTQIPLSTASDAKNVLSVAKGDRVIVEIKVKAEEPLQNLVLVDLLPGGFEIENPKLIPEAEDKDEANQEGGDDGYVYPPSHLELREDRLVVIEPWLNSGITTYRYTLRAITPGEYVLPPTMAEGMYEPSRKAILSGGQVWVTDR